jgi:hypothetical protein
MFKFVKKVWAALVSAVSHVATSPKTVLTAVAIMAVSAATGYCEGEPLSLTASGTTIAGYVATAATAALPIFAGLFGLRVIVRAFHSVAS